jgi:uncharacterized membrane protein
MVVRTAARGVVTPPHNGIRVAAPSPEASNMNIVKKSVTVMIPRADVYAFWRDFENLPRFMTHLKSVITLSDGRSHWVINGPADNAIEWDAELVADRPGELISWRTLSDGEGIASHSGSVRFADAPGDRGTEVHVELQYDIVGGGVAAALARLFGEEPGQKIADDLRRFKQVVETGEVVLSDGSLEGAGQGATKQRAAQPAAEAVR